MKSSSSRLVARAESFVSIARAGDMVASAAESVTEAMEEERDDRASNARARGIEHDG